MAQPFNLSQDKMPLAVELREATAANIALIKRTAKYIAEEQKGDNPPSKAAVNKLSLGLGLGLGFGDSVAHIPPNSAGGLNGTQRHHQGHTTNDSAKFL